MRGDLPFGIDEHTAMDFPIGDLMDESACYEFLVGLLHPDGLACPHCGERDRLQVHRRDRDPILVYRCIACRRIFNAFTGTTLKGTKRRPVELVLILRGIAQGVSTAQLARELGCGRPERLEFRHRLQELGFQNLDRMPLADAAVEADEMFQYAGKRGIRHPDEEDPPRRRANKAVGHGTWERDRPPVCGAVGRQSGRARLHVEHRTDRATLERVVVGSSREGAMAYTDEWRSYDHLPELGRGHAPVCHAIGEWARDDDGDGIREVHDNTLEGMWTGLRNHLRIFPGGQQGVLAPVCRDLRVVLQCEAGHAGVPPSTLGRSVSHHFPDMSQGGHAERPHMRARAG